ncbi:MAG: hypothetical protein ACI965_000399 [Paraglaciecola sp.]|jgi:hypothetical protein
MLKDQVGLSNQLQGHLEIVQQAKEFLLSISQQAYRAVLTPHFSGSAGAHMRHTIDHYLALKKGLVSGSINYNKRDRHSLTEQDPQLALTLWQDIEHWLVSVCHLDADLSLQVICESSLHESQNTQTQSTLARELVFVSSHAVHHFSLLAIIQSLQGLKGERNFGLAPATVSHSRKPG